MVKEILGWLIGTHRGTLVLFSKKRLELLSILEIPTTQHRILVKNMERFVSKLRSMKLAVPGAIGYFYAMQVALAPA